MSHDRKPSPSPPDDIYGPDYYASHCGGLVYAREEPHWARFFGTVAEQIIRSLRPRRVFDAGCAHGFLLEALWDRGVETWGRDISQFAVSQVRADLQPFVGQGSIAAAIETSCDLITCIEVLEHMDEEAAVAAIANMAAASARVLFSSSPTDLDEPTHVNIKPVIWWLHRFAEAGMAPSLDYDASFLTPHAYLLERVEPAPAPETLSLFAEMIRQRVQAHRLVGQIAAAQSALACANATAASSEQQRRDDASRAGTLLAAAEQECDGAKYAADLARTQLAALDKAAAAAARQHQAQLAAAMASRDAAAAGQARAQIERDMLQYSTIWRSTRLLRQSCAALPAPTRIAIRQTLRIAYWLVTFQWSRLKRHQRIPAEAAQIVLASYPVAMAKPEPPGDSYDRWVREVDTLSDHDRRAIHSHIASMVHTPLISIVMPVFETPERLLREAIASVQAQIYPRWELCIADDASPSSHVLRVVRQAADDDSRIKWVRRETNGHIGAATNSALGLATGEFVALMDHDDLLPEHALYEIAAELETHPATDLIYTDEDKVDASGRRSDPNFKPDWDLDLLYGQNFFSHFGVYRRSLLEEVGGLREGLVNGSQDYDLVLRCARAPQPSGIRHIPAVLYHWRTLETASSFSQAQLYSCIMAAHHAIRDDLAARGLAAEVEAAPADPRWTRIRWALPASLPRVTLIVPTRDRPELLRRCAEGVLNRTNYTNLELLVVDNDSVDPKAVALLDRLEQDERVTLLRFPGPFNYSSMNNAAVEIASGEVIVLLNNDIDVTDGDWLREMVSLAIRPDVGAVGAKLLFADGRIQHAGVALGVGTFDGGPGVAGHLGHLEPGSAFGPFGQFILARELTAVTGACLALRRAVFLAVGGLDAENLRVAFNDIDLCLRIRETGLRNLWTPFATLFHLESASRGSDSRPDQVARFAAETRYMRDRWGPLLDADPFYNANLSRTELFKPALPPRRVKPWLVRAT